MKKDEKNEGGKKFFFQWKGQLILEIVDFLFLKKEIWIFLMRLER